MAVSDHWEKTEGQTAQDTADSKRRTFVSQPVPPYDVGDLWAQGTSGDLMRCSTAKAAGASYAVSDWIKASKYTDDTTANAAQATANATANYFSHDAAGAHVGSVSGNPDSGRNLLMATGKIAFRENEVELALIDVSTVNTRDLMRLSCGDDYDGIMLDGGAYVVSKQHVADDTYGAYGSYVTCGMHETGAPRASMVAHRGDGTLAHPYDVKAELDVEVVGGKSYINTTADSFTYNGMHVRGQKTLWEGSWSSGSITVAGITAGQQLDVVVDGIVVHAAADSTDIAGVTTFYNIPSEDGVYRLGYIVLNLGHSGSTVTINKAGYMCPSLAGDTVFSKVITKITLLG